LAEATDAMKISLIRAGVVLLLVLVSGCGGSKVLKEPEPLVLSESLASASDERLSVNLDWVIVRDGPGTWAKNAFWDEYLLRVSNDSDRPIQLTELVVVDSLNTRIAAQQGRKQLVAGSKQTSRRYKESGIKVIAGSGRGTVGVAAATAAGAGVGAAIGAGAGGAAIGGAAGGAAIVGAVVLAPVLAVGGIARGVNHSAVNTQIEERQTILPLDLPVGDELGLDIFFPLAPSPQMVELAYKDATGDYVIVIHTSAVLNDLHIESSDE